MAAASLVVVLTAVLALAVVMVMEAVVGGMGLNGSPFLIDPESQPRVGSLSFRSSILPQYQGAEERCSLTGRTQRVKPSPGFLHLMGSNHVSQVSPHPHL